MNWIRFDKQLPPEDTTVMVSNGPAMGHYHYKEETYKYMQDSIIPLWSMDGERSECKVADLVQWATLLPVKAKEIKLTRWQKVKLWFQSLIG